LDISRKITVSRNAARNRPDCVKDSRVIATAKPASNEGLRMFGEFSREIHRDLTGMGKVPSAFCRSHVVNAELIEPRNFLLYLEDGQSRWPGHSQNAHRERR
jgi:hypothetical protein